jgi:hypothetical protein
VNHRSGGLPNRLGIDPSLICSAEEARQPQRASQRHLAMLDGSPADLDALLNARPPGLAAPLVTGGADLLRDVLWRMRQGDEVYEVCGLGRLSPAVLRWWFQRVRCLEFPRDGDLNAIRQRTSGIPFLVRILDELLVPPGEGAGGGQGGCNISAETMHGALLEFDRRLSTDGALLASGPPPVRLTPRELELLQMIYVASAAHGFAAEIGGREVNLGAALSEEWAELYAEAWQQHCPDRPAPAALTDTAEDQIALQVVELLGLVPTEPDRPSPAARLRPLERADALVRVLALGDFG